MMSRGWARIKASNRRGRRELPLRSRRDTHPSLLALIVIIAFARHSHSQVTFERLVNSAKEPQNWMTYSGSYSGQRFSKLAQINTGNVHTMVAKWVYQTAGDWKA